MFNFTVEGFKRDGTTLFLRENLTWQHALMMLAICDPDHRNDIVPRVRICRGIEVVLEYDTDAPFRERGYNPL